MRELSKFSSWEREKRELDQKGVRPLRRAMRQGVGNKVMEGEAREKSLGWDSPDPCPSPQE